MVTQKRARATSGADADAHLLHLGELEVEEAVDPVQELGAPHEEGGVLETDAGGGVSHRRAWGAGEACRARGIASRDEPAVVPLLGRIETASLVFEPQETDRHKIRTVLSHK